MTHGESRPADGERDMTQTFSAGPPASFSVHPYKYTFTGRCYNRNCLQPFYLLIKEIPTTRISSIFTHTSIIDNFIDNR